MPTSTSSKPYADGTLKRTSTGVSIEPYLARPNGRELMVGIFRDPTFGPIISFGAGGRGVEVFSDRKVALPPLNRFLVEDLIRSTRAAQLLGESHERPPVNMEALEEILLNISEMVCELPLAAGTRH